MNNINAIKVDIINNVHKKKKCDDLTDLSIKNNILEYYFNLPIKNKKAFIKIVTEDFNIPTYKEYKL